MALLLSEGFGWSTNATDYSTLGQWGAGLGAILTGGPFGDNYASISTTSGTPVITLPSLLSTFYFGARMNANGQNFGIYGISPSQTQFNVNFLGGTIEVRAAGNTLAGSVVTTAPVSGWFYIEVFGTVSATVGAVTVRINGVSVIALTGLNTKSDASYATVAGIKLILFTTPSPAYIAHVYICDNTGAAPWNTFLGDVRVQTLLPTANDAVAFTPNGLATNWQNAASVPPVPASDYNADATVGAQDTFAAAAMASGLGAIYAVNVKAMAGKSDAGPRSAATVIKSGSATGVATAVSIGATTAQQVPGIFETDPNTTAPWSMAAVNAAKIGYKITA
jgi:hypothetical protein